MNNFLKNQIVISIITTIICYGIFVFILDNDPTTTQKFVFVYVTFFVNLFSCLIHILSQI
jgi:hypothetical protein